MLDYDTHLHDVDSWPYELKGGVVLAIDDDKKDVLGAKCNRELELLDLPPSFIKAFHVSSNDVYLPKKAEALYFHPCRNNIEFDFIRKKIISLKPLYVVIDTFYGVSNLAIDLNSLVASLEDVKFLLAHGGGYDLAKIIQIARFNSNCFIDFSATLEILAKSNLVDIHKWLQHCNAEPRIREKVLFGSDYPEFCVDKHAALYRQFFEDDFLRKNFWYRFFNAS